MSSDCEDDPTAANATECKDEPLRDPSEPEGRLPPEVVQRVIRSARGKVKACYAKALQRQPDLQGRVTVRFLIARSGRVTKTDACAQIADGVLSDCVRHVFDTLVFPAPEGGVVTVRYPVVFSPGS
jgi:hypothetical protein